MCKWCNWVIPEKIHTPTTEGMLENLTGGGVNGSGNPDGRGALNLKIRPRGNLIDFIDVSIASIAKFSKHCFAFFKFYYSFKLQTSYHIYSKFPSVGSPLLLL